MKKYLPYFVAALVLVVIAETIYLFNTPHPTEDDSELIENLERDIERLGDSIEFY